MKEFLKRLPFLTLGASIAAFSLEVFLVPNDIIDGGVVGVSIILSYLTKFELGLFTFILNLPFLALAFKNLGKRFVVSTLYAVIVMSIMLAVLKAVPAITNQPLLSTVFGGAILGLGVGIVLRAGGSLDGTEILSIELSKKIGFSVGQIIMFINLFIFIAAGFVFASKNGIVYGAEKSMLSILTYFLAYKVIDMVLEGFDDSKSVQIITDYAYEIGNNIIKNMDTSVTYIDAIGGYSHTHKKIIFCVITRLEITKLKEIVRAIDPNAFISIESVQEVEGKRYKKSSKTF